MQQKAEVAEAAKAPLPVKGKSPADYKRESAIRKLARMERAYEAGNSFGDEDEE